MADEKDELSTNQQDPYEEDTEKAGEQKDETPRPSDKTLKTDAAHKIVYSLCYLYGILFFLPLVAYPNDAQGRKHANMGLVLLILSFAGNLVFGLLRIVPILNIIFAVVSAIYNIAILVLAIMGIYYACTDRDADLPIIGKIKLIK